MDSGAGFVIEKLSAVHELSPFNCGNDALNTWLKRFARANSQNDSARVYVAHSGDRVVVGYHALTAGSIARAEAPERVAHGALTRSEQAANTVGVRAVLVQAINDSARSFYLHFGFSPTPMDDLRLILLMKDPRALLKSHRYRSPE